MQFRLSFILHFVIATTLMGILVTAALSMGYGTARPILIAAVVGYLLSLPISVLIARKITHLQKL